MAFSKDSHQVFPLKYVSTLLAFNPVVYNKHGLGDLTRWVLIWILLHASRENLHKVSFLDLDFLLSKVDVIVPTLWKL